MPGGAERVAKIVNPENRPAYAGPTGTVRGLVTAKGDAPLDAKEHLAKIKGPCPDARESYAKIFREGMMRSLADVQFMAFPRLAAIAEIGWTPRAARDWSSFRRRLAALGPRWAAQGVNYFRSPEIDWPAED